MAPRRHPPARAQALLGLLTAATLSTALFVLPPRLLGAGLQDAPLPTLRFALGMCLPVFVGVFSRAPFAVGARRGGAAALDGLAGLALGTAGFHVLAVVFGAPIDRQVAETLHWAALMGTLVALPVACTVGLGRGDWVRLYAASQPRGGGEVASCVPGHGAAVGAWLGAVPIPLDWDRPWQAWPVSCVYGAAAGYLMGAVGVAAWVAEEEWIRRRKGD